MEGDSDGFLLVVGFVLGDCETMDVGVADGAFDFDGAVVYRNKK